MRFWDDGNVLELDFVDNCTTFKCTKCKFYSIKIYLNRLESTCKIVNIVEDTQPH